MTLSQNVKAQNLILSPCFSRIPYSETNPGKYWIHSNTPFLQCLRFLSAWFLLFCGLSGCLSWPNKKWTCSKKSGFKGVQTAPGKHHQCYSRKIWILVHSHPWNPSCWYANMSEQSPNDERNIPWSSMDGMGLMAFVLQYFGILWGKPQTTSHMNEKDCTALAASLRHIRCCHFCQFDSLLKRINPLLISISLALRQVLISEAVNEGIHKNYTAKRPQTTWGRKSMRQIQSTVCMEQ